MEVLNLPGLTPYRQAHALMLRVLEERIAERRPDTLIFVEHPPVVTRGRGLQWTGEARERHVPLAPLPAGVECVDIERGGDLTYHGPGQLVVYPICKLDGAEGSRFARHDVMGFLRKFESIVIDELGRLGLIARSDANASGVWVQQGDGAAYASRKIASIGISVRKWVTFHGLALNLTTDLSHFQWISPCGFSPDVMTRVADLGLPVECSHRDYWQRKLAHALSFRDVLS